MIFKLHYWFMSSGANALGLLLGVFIETYTDASSTEIGSLYMLMPLVSLIFKPIICSMADRKQAHQKFMINCLFFAALSYTPFVIIPLLGPEVYDVHPRLCWYSLVAFKILGDIAFGGATSLGDSLAINYAKRIGTEFSVYRVWATISWMVFGVIVGQINEIWFLPKYVPGFIILISASLLDMFVIWLWPPEYFIMVAHNKDTTKTSNSEIATIEEPKIRKKKKENAFTKSLLPKEVVWAHMKARLSSLFTCNCLTTTKKHESHENEMAVGTKNHQMNSINKLEQNEKIDCDKTSTTICATNYKKNDTGIDKRTQLRILTHLLRRDLRIIAYLIMFICSGFTTISMSFLFMQLSELCNTNNRCNFSQLGGLLQLSMASIEAVLFVYITRIIEKVGRLNMVAFSFFVIAIKYTFYGTIWPQVSPYYSLLLEMPHGLIFAIFLTLTVEMAHLFANEVEYILPELIESGAIDKDANVDKLRLSLSATMQALVSSASDGIGRGVGALIYGLILDSYSFEVLWLTIGIGGAVVFAIVVLVNTLDHLFKFQLGLDVAHQKKSCIGQEANEEWRQSSFSTSNKGSIK